MPFLIAVSLLWAFSFGLIGSRLSGIDSNFSAAVRLSIAFICFLPFFRLQNLTRHDLLKLVGIGALQLGAMYIAYMRAYVYLPSHLVALFSVLTPLYIVFAHNLTKRRWTWGLLGSAVLSIVGAAIIKYSQAPEGDFWIGFGLMQIANLSFGIGQLLYRSWKVNRPEVHDSQVIAALYLGGALLAGLGFALLGDTSKIHPTPDQWYILIYLGAIASGVGFFWWNKGAARTSPGVLASCNNLIIPIAMAISLFRFNEAAAITPQSLTKLLAGGALIFTAIFWGKKSDANS